MWASASSAAPLVFEPKKHEPVPPTASNQPCDGAERLERAALIFEIVCADRHAVLQAFPGADQPRAGNRAICSQLSPSGGLAFKLIGDGLQSLQSLFAQAAV